MLVLSRKIGERIVIDDNIEIVILKCGGRQVRLGIEAPHQVPVRRQEIGRVSNNAPGPRDPAT